MNPAQARHEARVLPVQVLEDEALAAADHVGLLIARRRVEERAVEPLGERPPVKASLREGRVRAEALDPVAPGGGDGPKGDGLDVIRRARDRDPDGLQVWKEGGAVRVGRVGADADRVFGARSAGGPLVAEGHLREPADLAQAALAREGPLAEDLDGFIELADEEPRDEASNRLAPGREGVADEEDVGARLEGGEIARGVEAPGGIVVPVVVLFVRGLLVGRELGGDGREVEGGLADDREGVATGPGLPDERGHRQGA
jgi:hypothetical protein